MYAAAFDFLAEIFAWPLMQFYALTHSYAMSIMLITVVVMAVTTPLTLKSTKGMLEMQKIQPELRKLQQQYRGDRQMLNQEMMKLYQEHKVNPLASCFPLLLQMPVFFGMFSLLRGLTRETDPTTGFFKPRIIDTSSELYQSLSKKSEMVSWGLDLAKSPAHMLNDDPARGVLYVLIVVFLGFLYWVQQRMIANRSVSATMSPVQAKIMQYLPVGFAVFQVFFPLGLVVYYIWQTILRVGQQYYITRRFYHGDASLGRQAQAASAAAREIAKADKASGGGAKPAIGQGRAGGAKGSSAAPKRPTAPERGRSQPTARPGANKPTGGAKPAGGAKASGGRPTPSGKAPRPQTLGGGKAASPAKPVKPQKPVKPTKPTKPSA